MPLGTEEMALRPLGPNWHGHVLEGPSYLSFVSFSSTLLDTIFDTLDAIRFALTFLATCVPGASVDWLVLDFTEAYWQIPDDPKERRMLCATCKIKEKDKFIAHLRAVHGPSNAPLCWARAAVSRMRLTQSLFSKEEVRLHCSL